ncbi:MAG: GIY-YIG nuclease family protein, partial [Candidatus Sulfotelmatobacter sp.]
MPRKKKNQAGTPEAEASSGLVPETEAIRNEIEFLLDTKNEAGIRIGSMQHGVYAFYDYFGEPIYVGQTKETIGTRVRRHLTNQRTDAVAMSVLDPIEVAEVEVWPLDLKGKDKAEVELTLARAEYTVYKRVLEASKLKFVLNEKDIPPTEEIVLPGSYRHRIVPSPIYEARQHRDIRIAQRAATIADLAKVIVERKVKKGLRRTLHFQAVRLQDLA